ncbi:MAG: hypothetical protein QOJ40_2541 [Verrucomicrobiota bacterium]
MGVDVSASRYGLDSFSDWPAIFNDWFVLRQVPHGNLVAQGNIPQKFDAPRPFAFQGHDANAGSFFKIHDRDTDIIVGLMQKNSVLHNVNFL